MNKSVSYFGKILCITLDSIFIKIVLGKSLAWSLNNEEAGH